MLVSKYGLCNWIQKTLSSFSLEQFEMSNQLTTVFSYDVEEIINVQQRQNIKGFVMQQCSLLWNSFVHAFWRYLNRQ